MIHILSMVAITLGLGIASAQELKYDREIVLHLEYGLEPHNVGIITPTKGADYPMSFGPRHFKVIGDSAIYIADVCNCKIKRFKFGAGLELVTEGSVDCLNGFVVGSSGKIYVVGPSGDRDITAFSREGILLSSTQRTPTDDSGRSKGTALMWAPESLLTILSEASEAGLGELRNPTLRDATGQTYTYQRISDNRKSVRFTPDDGSISFTAEVQDSSLPGDLQGVQKIKYWNMDNRERVYAVCAASKEQPTTILSWPDRESLVSPWDAVVLVYDRSGAFLGGIRYDYPPPFMVSYYDVAKVMPNGNIYCYNYTAEGLQVVRYRPIEED